MSCMNAPYIKILFVPQNNFWLTFNLKHFSIASHKVIAQPTLR